MNLLQPCKDEKELKGCIINTREAVELKGYTGRKKIRVERVPVRFVDAKHHPLLGHLQPVNTYKQRKFQQDQVFPRYTLHSHR